MLPVCHVRTAGQYWTFLLVSVLTHYLCVIFSLSIYLPGAFGLLLQIYLKWVSAICWANGVRSDVRSQGSAEE